MPASTPPPGSLSVELWPGNRWGLVRWCAGPVRYQLVTRPFAKRQQADEALRREERASAGAGQ